MPIKKRSFLYSRRYNGSEASFIVAPIIRAYALTIAVYLMVGATIRATALTVAATAIYIARFAGLIEGSIPTIPLLTKV